MMLFTTQEEFDRHVSDNQDDLRYWDVMNLAKDEGLDGTTAIEYAGFADQAGIA